MTGFLHCLLASHLQLEGKLLLVLELYNYVLGQTSHLYAREMGVYISELCMDGVDLSEDVHWDVDEEFLDRYSVSHYSGMGIDFDPDMGISVA